MNNFALPANSSQPLPAMHSIDCDKNPPVSAIIRNHRFYYVESTGVNGTSERTSSSRERED